MKHSSTTRYRVVAWDSTTVQVGTLRGADLDLSPVPTDEGFRDIRNCSVPADGSWVVVVGVDATTGKHAIWRVDLTHGEQDQWVEADYLLYGAVERTGSFVAYTAPPSRTRGDMSVHVFDVARRRARLLLDGTVGRSCIPSWRLLDRILIHTESRQVAEVDVGSGDLRQLFPGEYPVAAPDGTRIAYRDGQIVRLVGGDGVPVDISRPRGPRQAPYRGGMSWSPDGHLLLLARTAGTLGYELDFGTLDVTAREYTRIRQRYLQGIVFY